MSREAEVDAASVRLKRWAKAAEEAGMVKGGAHPEVRYSELYPVGSRWRVYEMVTWSLDGNADGPQTKTEACVAAAPTSGEVMSKYVLFAQDENRVAKCVDRAIRGEAHRPPKDPPEWQQARADMTANAVQAGERTAGWVKRSVREQWKAAGLDNAVNFERIWQEAQARGLVPK